MVLLLALPTGARRANAAEVQPTPEGDESAQPEADPSETAAPTAEEPADLGELWRQSQVALGTSDYPTAIERLTVIYDRVALDPDSVALRRRVQWSLHEAHLGAFGVDGDPSHLHIAADLLGKYAEDLDEADVEQRERAAASLAEVEALIAGLPEPEPEPEPVPEPEPQPQPQPQPEPEPEPEPEPQPARRSDGRPLLITGAVFTGLGVAATGMLVGGLVSANRAVTRFEEEPEQRADARSDIRRGNTLGVAGGVMAGAFIVSGAVLLALGIQRGGRGFRASVGRSGIAGSWTTRF